MELLYHVFQCKVLSTITGVSKNYPRVREWLMNLSVPNQPQNDFELFGRGNKIPKQVLQILIAMFVMDTWQYFVHRYMHQNKFLYRHIHSQHHRLVAPYAVGALYNHPIEGLLLDIVGGTISYLISGMTARTAVVFFCFVVVKTVDDHRGLWLPENIFHLLF
ncbi:hypothetical protein RIF29_22586 [Crotalaria pallida]|uniref:Fatty acid hydroxylase domain-containing protein n=1 Tax=Crotalaria pallida TaxID=3830 RepID=A0AAN9I6Z5_CROPI